MVSFRIGCIAILDTPSIYVSALDMDQSKVGVIGASSMVGQYALEQLAGFGVNVIAFSRKSREQFPSDWPVWQQLGVAFSACISTQQIPYWLCLCPIWKLPEHFDLIKASGARRVVALSSTSKFTKTLAAGSSDEDENALAEQLTQGEYQLQCWANKNNVEWVILRPTLIYDFVQDKNVTQIANYVYRYGCFPIFDGARGRRQPVHAFEVAGVACAAMWSDVAANTDYNISGGETLTYREMVERIFLLMGRKPRLVNIPIWGFRIAVFFANRLRKYRHLSTAMALRMNQDLVFDHSKARTDLDFAPGKFAEDKTRP